MKTTRINSEVHPRGAKDKIERYKWKVQDARGTFQLIHKNDLQMHPAYQRHAISPKIRAMSANWSWIACGTVTVGKRGGEYWVIDAQHRVLAARNRSDIHELPCLVFNTESVEQEAIGFLNANTSRKPVSSIDKFRASIASGCETATFVSGVFTTLGIVPSMQSKGPMTIKSVAWAMKAATADRKKFETVLTVMSRLCTDHPIKEKVADALLYMSNAGIDITSDRFYKRIEAIGVVDMENAASKASAFFVRGGAKIWAEGILLLVNKCLRDKYELQKK